MAMWHSRFYKEKFPGFSAPVFCLLTSLTFSLSNEEEFGGGEKVEMDPSVSEVTTVGMLCLMSVGQVPV